jgi:hypothetical protein
MQYVYIPLPTYGKNPYHIVNCFAFISIIYFFNFGTIHAPHFKWKTIIRSFLAHVALILGTWL